MGASPRSPMPPSAESTRTRRPSRVSFAGLGPVQPVAPSFPRPPLDRRSSSGGSSGSGRRFAVCENQSQNQTPSPPSPSARKRLGGSGRGRTGSFLGESPLEDSPMRHSEVDFATLGKEDPTAMMGSSLRADTRRGSMPAQLLSMRGAPTKTDDEAKSSSRRGSFQMGRRPSTPHPSVLLELLKTANAGLEAEESQGQEQGQDQAGLPPPAKTFAECGVQTSFKQAAEAAGEHEKSADAEEERLGNSYTVQGPLPPLQAAKLCYEQAVGKVVPSFAVSTESDGEEGTKDFRIFYQSAGKRISPWHDIPLTANLEGTVFNMVCEIPKFAKAKLECCLEEEGNPIKQDIKKGKLRYYHGPIFWNYGFLPQTWEDPNVVHPELKAAGDGDPVDVVEIGSVAHNVGAIVQVKVLGVLAMIDEGEVDWKVIAISTSDPLANELNDIEDVHAKCEGVVSGILEWFRWYKTPDGKVTNKFGFEENALDKEETVKVILETHASWESIARNEVKTVL